MSDVFRFSDLPAELQLMIWEYTLSTENHVDLTYHFLLHARPFYYRDPIRIPSMFAAFIKLASLQWDSKANDSRYQVRQKMMILCTDSRKLALQAWKKDIEAIDVGDAIPVDLMDKFWVKQLKREIVKLLDARFTLLGETTSVQSLIAPLSNASIN